MKHLPKACVLSAAVCLSACSSNSSPPSGDDNDATGEQNPLTEESTGAGSGDTTEPNADDQPALAMLSMDNYKLIGDYLLGFFTNEQFLGPRLPSISSASFIPLQNAMVDPETGVEKSLFTCSNGGEVARVFSATEPTVLQFTNCQHEGAILDGQYGYIFGKYNSVRDYLDFTANINGGTSVHEATGKISFQSSTPPCNVIQRNRDVAQYKITLSDQVFEIKDWNTSFSQRTPAEALCDEDKLEMSGRYSVRSSDTDNNWLDVEASETISGTADNPTAGVIVITAEDASSVELDFATGDEKTVSVTVTNSAGVNTFEEQTADWTGQLLP